MGLLVLYRHVEILKNCQKLFAKILSAKKQQPTAGMYIWCPCLPYVLATIRHVLFKKLSWGNLAQNMFAQF